MYHNPGVALPLLTVPAHKRDYWASHFRALHCTNPFPTGTFSLLTTDTSERVRKTLEDMDLKIRPQLRWSRFHLPHPHIKQKGTSERHDKRHRENGLRDEKKKSREESVVQGKRTRLPNLKKNSGRNEKTAVCCLVLTIAVDPTGGPGLQKHRALAQHDLQPHGAPPRQHHQDTPECTTRRNSTTFFCADRLQVNPMGLPRVEAWSSRAERPCARPRRRPPSSSPRQRSPTEYRPWTRRRRGRTS